jgi:hypothetical protein
MSKKAKLKDLIPDNKNFNKGSEFGNGLIEKSLERFGAGRSILIDKNNRIIAGNKTVENAASIGLEDVEIIESDGKRIIAVKRNDIDLDSPLGREMALADNATAKANIVWDAEVIEATIEPAIVQEWGVVNYAKGHSANLMNDEDVNLDEEFDPIGNSDGKQRVVFLFDGKDEAESYLNSIKVKFVKRNVAWQVDLCTQSIL